jgi:hypothetical protein
MPSSKVNGECIAIISDYSVLDFWQAEPEALSPDTSHCCFTECCGNLTAWMQTAMRDADSQCVAV